jgi:hypothetical protein
MGAGFASFWHGPLNPFAWACLASFPRAGAELTLYSYDPAIDVPPGVRLADARAICSDPTLVHRMTVNGKPSIATFSDLFRYRMIRDTGACWVDADLICLANPAFADDPYVFCRQADFVSTLLVNNAVLRLPADEPALVELIATGEAAVGRDQSWGALGPFLLTPVLEKHRAFEPKVCYPVEPELFWTLFLPGRRSEVQGKLEGATLLHLWSEAIRWTGYDLSVCPPEGSCLHGWFASLQALGRFARIADEAEVLRMMAKPIHDCDARPSRDGA